MGCLISAVRNITCTLQSTRSFTACKTAAALLLCFASMPGIAEVIRDQGRIFGTGGTVEVTENTLSQSITAGISGQLAAIKIQLNAEVPTPAPHLNLAILTGGHPPVGKVLFSELLDLRTAKNDDILTWDVRKANLVFNSGDQFVFTISTSALGVVIAANDPPGYPGGELYLNGRALPPYEMNDIAFITYVVQPPAAADDPIPEPDSHHPAIEPGDVAQPPTAPEDIPGWSGHETGLVIAANDPPGYPGGQLYMNGTPLPGDRRNDLAFITYMIDSGQEASSGNAAGLRRVQDQGQIFGTDGTVQITADTLAQSVTAGISGQLAAITMQWNAELPDEPVPLLNLGLLAGGDPSTWKTLFLEQLHPVTGLAVDSTGVFTWDLTEANLHFEKGDAYTFTLSAEPGHTDAQAVSAADIGVIANDPEVLTRDCGYSARYRDRSIWFFGDTILKAPNADNQRILCNSWSLTHDQDAADGVTGFQPPVDEIGSSISLVPLTEAERRFNLRHQGKECLEPPCGTRWAIWPGTIAVDQEAKVAYVFYHKVLVETGDFNYTSVGHSIAILEDIDGQADRPDFSLYEDYPTLMFSEERDGFGSAAVLVGRQLYVYGCELQLEGILKPCRLARVAIDKILERDAWQFYQGQGTWSYDLSAATTVFHGNDMMSVFYNEHLSRYIAIYSQPLSTRVMMRTAERPEGPWSQASELFDGRKSAGSWGWIYDALAHPELSTDNGKTTYITYSRNTGPFKSEFRLVAVELALIQ